jgi:hypothetical protein
MARLIVEAGSAESTSGDVVSSLSVGVSVSHASDGKAVTGLKAENFRVASHIGVLKDKDFKVGLVSEWKWEPADVQPAGCYDIEIHMTGGVKFFKGARYIFGIQARTFSKRSRQGPRKVIDQGQTIIELISMGE